jgi:hypothetical protein
MEGKINNKITGILLEWEALSHCAKSMSTLIGDEASCVSIFDGLRQFEDEVQAGLSSKALVICLAVQKVLWPPRLPCPLLTCFRSEEGTQQRCRSPELFGHC